MILFTADVHLKLGQKGVPKDWAVARYSSLFGQLNVAAYEYKVDRLVVGGDLFDRVPSLEELQLYIEFIKGLQVETIIFDGNHEASRKGKTFLSTLADVTKIVNPLVTIVTEVTEYDWGTVLPYCKLHSRGVIEGLNKNKPLFTHVRGEIPPHVKPEIDLDLLSDFPVVFAGDLHAHSNTQLNIVYPGSPVTTSFHREEVTTGYLIIDDLIWEWKTLNLPQLVRRTVSDPIDMVPTPWHHTIYELEGDISELADVRNSDLLDKKVIRRSTEATLLLDKRMTVQEELSEYLLYILELQQDTVDSVIGTFSDNIKET